MLFLTAFHNYDQVANSLRFETKEVAENCNYSLTVENVSLLGSEYFETLHELMNGYGEVSSFFSTYYWEIEEFDDTLKRNQKIVIKREHVELMKRVLHDREMRTEAGYETHLIDGKIFLLKLIADEQITTMALLELALGEVTDSRELLLFQMNNSMYEKNMSANNFDTFMLNEFIITNTTRRFIDFRGSFGNEKDEYEKIHYEELLLKIVVETCRNWKIGKHVPLLRKSDLLVLAAVNDANCNIHDFDLDSALFLKHCKESSACNKLFNELMSCAKLYSHTRFFCHVEVAYGYKSFAELVQFYKDHQDSDLFDESQMNLVALLEYFDDYSSSMSLEIWYNLNYSAAVAALS